MNNSVSFRDALNPSICKHSDFRVSKSSNEHISFLLENGIDIRFFSVTHLFSCNIGVIPYSEIWSKANKYFNYYQPKQEIGIPFMVRKALMEDGWICRQTIIWHKPNPMPESVTDRCTKSHEYIFLLSKSAKYYFDLEAIQEEATGYDGRKDTFFKGSTKYLNGFAPEGTSEQTLAKKGHERWKKRGHKEKDGETGLSEHHRNDIFTKRKNDGTNHGGNGTGFQDHSGYSNLENPYIRNKRSVWTVNTKPYADAHFATFPEDLIMDCIKAGCPKRGLVLDPFMGAGTTALVSRKLGRNYVGIELNEKYIKIANDRLYKELGMFL